MSSAARIFAEGYRDKPLKVEDLAGIEHLIPGQHEAIWNDPPNNTLIELSYVNVTGHKFIVLVVEADNLNPLLLYEIDIFGVDEKMIPRDFILSDKMRDCLIKLKIEDASAAA